MPYLHVHALHTVTVVYSSKQVYSLVMPLATERAEGSGDTAKNNIAHWNVIVSTVWLLPCDNVARVFTWFIAFQMDCLLCCAPLHPESRALLKSKEESFS